MLDTLLFDRYGNTISNLTQYDLDQVLFLYDMDYPVAPIFEYEVESMENSIAVQTEYTANRVLMALVPNILLQKANRIKVYVFLPEGRGGKIVDRFIIPVLPHKRPSLYEFRDNLNDGYPVDGTDDAYFDAERYGIVLNYTYPGEETFPGEDFYPGATDQGQEAQP